MLIYWFSVCKPIHLLHAHFARVSDRSCVGKLALGGHEILLLTNLSPILLAFGPLRRMIARFYKLPMVLAVGSLFSFLWYRTRYRFMIEDAWIRTVVTCTGNGLAILAMTGKWWRERHDVLQSHKNGLSVS